MMMKKLLFLVLLITCVPVCSASIADDDTTIDGYLSTGEYETSRIDIEGTEQLIVEGGGAFRIQAFDYSYLEVQYTSTPLSNNSGIYDILLDDYSELLYLSGITQEIALYGHSKASLKGGRIDGLNIYHGPTNSCYVTIYCQPGYQKNSNGISGLWADGTSFDIDFIDHSPYTTAPYVNIIEVPEPATLALLGLGGLLIRRKKTFK